MGCRLWGCTESDTTEVAQQQQQHSKSSYHPSSYKDIKLYLDSVGEGEGGMIWENGIETCIILYMKRIASPGSMHDTGRLGLVYWDDPEEWYGEGGKRRGSGWGTGVYLWRIHVDVWQNQYNIVK